MHRIVVEGMDNTGKTTLIEALAKKLQAVTVKSYFKYRKPHEANNFHRYFTFCSFNIIADRHPFISDLVYGPVIRGTTPCTEEGLNFVRDQFTLIYCRPPIEKIFETLDARDQMKGVKEQGVKLLDRYDHLMGRIRPNFTYDFTTQQPGDIPNECFRDF